MTTARDHYLNALLVELRKAPSKRSSYRIRKYRKGIIDYDKGFRDGEVLLEFPAFVNGEEVTRLENGRATARRIKYGGLNHAEVRS